MKRCHVEVTNLESGMSRFGIFLLRLIGPGREDHII